MTNSPLTHPEKQNAVYLTHLCPYLHRHLTNLLPKPFSEMLYAQTDETRSFVLFSFAALFLWYGFWVLIPPHSRAAEGEVVEGEGRGGRGGGG
jgi:hypothetical protein